MLDATAPLPHPLRRVLVAGLSGSGKTTLAGELGRILDLPHVELDALHHGPGWQRRPEFLDDVRRLAGTERWVTEWQYGDARPLLTPRADLLVWLDLPFALVLARLARRTVMRRLRREVLYHGNVEPPLHTILTDPGHVVRYMIATRRKYAGLVPAAVAAHPHLTVVRLRTPREVRRWLAGLRGLRGQEP